MPYTVFPDALYDPTPTAKRNGVVAPEEWLEVIDNLGGVTASLGVNPATSSVTGLGYGTVDARLEAIETAVAAFGATGIRNLRITNNSATPNSKLDISWSTLGIQGVITEGFSVTLDRGAGPGANGRDADFNFANGTWYWLYAIYGDAAGVAVVLSQNGAPNYVPALPTGYTRYRRIGAVATGSNGGEAGNFLRYLQQDCTVVYHGNDTGAVRVLSVFTRVPAYPTFADLSCVAAIPPTANLATFMVGLAGLSSGSGSGVHVRGSGGELLGGGGIYVINGHIAPPSETRRTGVDLPCSGQKIQYSYDGNSTGGGIFIEVQGYYDPI